MATPTYTGNEELAGPYPKAVGPVAADVDVRARLDDLERMTAISPPGRGSACT